MSGKDEKYVERERSGGGKGRQEMAVFSVNPTKGVRTQERACTHGKRTHTSRKGDY